MITDTMIIHQTSII